MAQHIPEINQMLGKSWRFQQDNDPKHTSRVAKDFIQKNIPKIMDWPSNSPDLNPIENQLKAMLRGECPKIVES